MYAVIFVNVLGATVTASIQSIISGAADARSQGRTLGAVSAINSLMAVVAPLLGAPLLGDGLAPSARRLAHRRAVLLLRGASGRGAGSGGPALSPRTACAPRGCGG